MGTYLTLAEVKHLRAGHILEDWEYGDEDQQLRMNGDHIHERHWMEEQEQWSSWEYYCDADDIELA